MSLFDILPRGADGGSLERDAEFIAVQRLGDGPLHSSGPWRHVNSKGEVISVDITSHDFSFTGVQRGSR